MRAVVVGSIDKGCVADGGCSSVHACVQSVQWHTVAPMRFSLSEVLHVSLPFSCTHHLFFSDSYISEIQFCIVLKKPVIMSEFTCSH